MSKSKGNVLDPIDLIDGIDLESLVSKRTSGLMQPRLAPGIEKATRRQFPDGIPEFGTDALRFTFLSLATTGRDIRFDLGRIEGYRNFCNKLWNASRFVLNSTDGIDLAQAGGDAAPEERWIRSRLSHCITEVERQFARYRLDLAAQALYEFTWHEFCDWFVEIAKATVYDDDASAADRARIARTLLEVLDALLRCLHPLMPFITEEIGLQVAARLGIERDTLCTAPWPDAGVRDTHAEADLVWLQGVTAGIRQIRGEMDIPPGRALPVRLAGANDTDRERVARLAPLLTRLANLESLDFDEQPPRASAVALVDALRLCVPMAGLIDAAQEIERLSKLQRKTASDLEKTEGKLANPRFVDRAPADVVAEERRRAEAHQAALARIEDQLEALRALGT